jgi:hypothetical protein
MGHINLHKHQPSTYNYKLTCVSLIKPPDIIIVDVLFWIKEDHAYHTHIVILSSPADTDNIS